MHKSTITYECIQTVPVIALNGSPGVLVYVCPLTVNDTLTLNWYCCPSCSPDTTPEEALAGKVTVPELTCLFLPLLSTLV